MRMLACCEEFLKEKKRSLSTSATRASPPVLLYIRYKDPDDATLVLMHVPPP
jgi:hypothetical protein